MDSTPVLVYDGDCRFCRSWVDYWAALCQNRLQFRPYQQAAADFPQLSEDEFRRHIQLFASDGRRYRGAAAAFQVLRQIPGKGGWWWLYRHLPGFAPLSEWFYDRVAAHRGLAFGVQKLLWGEHLREDRQQLTSWLFLRLLALIWLAALLSFWWQADGLVGSGGLLPLQDFMGAARADPQQSFWQLPSLLWWWHSDLALHSLCASGVGASLLLLCNRLVRPSLVALYLVYLSLFYGGQVFMQYQWDLLLLEAGFLAIFLGRGRGAVVWLYRLLLLRFVFLSGVVKLLSGDPAWAQFEALGYHFETQPLPSPLAWYAAQLPAGVLGFFSLATLLIELLLAPLMLLPRRARMLAGWGLIALQLAILLTGNFGFFNLLTLALCLFLFDDHALGRLPGLRRLQPGAAPRAVAPLPGTRRIGLVLLCLLLVSLNVGQLWLTLQRTSVPAPLLALVRICEPWHWVNRYGLFAVVTRQRFEIVIEGSVDGRTWRAYELPFKPGAPERRPRWNIPHQPRLDWQLWFAALEAPRQAPWIRPLLVHVLFATPQVMALFAHDPFAGDMPTRVRARLFVYRFASAQVRATEGVWWERQLAGDYHPPIRLQIGVEAVPGAAQP